tara:strand:- start:1572 stop:1973 length:402 start_codon:yes stop_codon:yes gene_type:complete
MPNLNKLPLFLDKYAISISAICAIHCLSLPIILGVFPAFSATILGQELFHELLLWLVIPLSLVSLSLGCKRHKSWFVASFGLTGLIVLTLTATIGHDVLGESAERVATIIGALSIAIGHFRNYRLCRKSVCPH